MLDIVAAHPSRYRSAPAELPSLVVGMGQALATQGRTRAAPATERPKPAVPMRRSIETDPIVCLENGLRFKSLKRRLTVLHGPMPDRCRAEWGLAADHPMAAPGYAATRAALARETGLGRHRVSVPV